MIIWCTNLVDFVEGTRGSAVRLASHFSCLLSLHRHFAGKGLSPPLTMASSFIFLCLHTGGNQLFIGMNYGPEQPLHDVCQSHRRPFCVGCWHLKFFTPQLLLHIVKISHRSVHNTHEKLLKIGNMLCGDIHHLLICLREDSQQQAWLHLFWSFTFGRSILRRLKAFLIV